MNELNVSTDTPITYRKLIKEVFIDPIRTAVAVDDEYPTLDELLVDSNLSDEEKVRREHKRANWPKVREILKFCRSNKPIPWMVDIHDGRTPPLDVERDSASHLDHSDLLILDYHLESHDSGQKAIEILQQLAGNGHFNLVVVYTKDREQAGGGIDRAINDIALSLAFPIASLNLHEGKVRNLENKMSSWEDIQDDILSVLMNCVDQIAFLKILAQNDRSWEIIRDMPELVPLGRYLNAIPETVHINANEVLDLLMHKRQDEHKNKMSSDSYGRVTTGKGEHGINWVRTDSLFVTVISKEHDASSIPERLLNALEAWDPPPHRLIMSKMRSELAQQGVLAETGVLRNRHLQAGWLKEILEPDEAKRRSNVGISVTRHWESLGGNIESSVMDFSERVATYLSSLNSPEMVQNRFDHEGAYKQKEEVLLQLNCHACSKPVEGHHLSTGHVLRVQFDKNSHQYWLCLTPACDLVPGQGDEKGWKKRLGTWLPFKAVRIYHAEKNTALKNATRGNHLFLQLEDKLEAFGFAEKSDERDGALPPLRWEQSFAYGDGKLGSSNELKVASIGKNGTLNNVEYEAVVVAQLRYEYSLNLMHKLGSHLSRVGLDFSPY